jgi:hypothetical protein
LELLALGSARAQGLEPVMGWVPVPVRARALPQDSERAQGLVLERDSEMAQAQDLATAKEPVREQDLVRALEPVRVPVPELVLGSVQALEMAECLHPATSLAHRG